MLTRFCILKNLFFVVVLNLALFLAINFVDCLIKLERLIINTTITRVFVDTINFFLKIVSKIFIKLYYIARFFI